MHTAKWFQVLLYNSHNLTSVICSVCSIWHICRALSGVTTQSQSEPGSNGNERGTPHSDGLSYPGHLLGESYPSAEMQSEYSTSPTDWTIKSFGYMPVPDESKCISIIY